MYSITKIYQKRLLKNEHESFHFDSVDYSKVRGIFMFGSADVSLCMKNGTKIQFESLDISAMHNVAPNKRALILDKPLTDELIQGTIVKTRAKGLASIYLLLE